MDKEQQKLLTEQHISSSTGVYHYVPPSRTYNGESRDIVTPTEVSFNRQIKMKTEMLETYCNDLWKKISERRNLSSILESFLLVTIPNYLLYTCW